MEKRDLYNKDKQLTGKTIYKGQPIPKGYYILVVLIYIQNSNGEFLIQKRSKIKNGLYAGTGGHAKTGESSVQAICTEVKEEIGLDLNVKDLQLYYSGMSDKSRVFWDDYYIKMDISDIEKLKIQEEEVESVHWFSKEEIIELNNNGEFFENHFEEFERLLDWLSAK